MNKKFGVFRFYEYNAAGGIEDLLCWVDSPEELTEAQILELVEHDEIQIYEFVSSTYACLYVDQEVCYGALTSDLPDEYSPTLLAFVSTVMKLLEAKRAELSATDGPHHPATEPDAMSRMLAVDAETSGLRITDNIKSESGLPISTSAELYVLQKRAEGSHLSFAKQDEKDIK